MRKLKEYKAYDFQELSYEIEDNIRDKEYKRMIATIAAENDVEVIKKGEENAILNRTQILLYGCLGVLRIVLWQASLFVDSSSIRSFKWKYWGTLWVDGVA